MPIYDDLDDQGGFGDFLERCRHDFEATRNPLYAWEAWGLVRFTWRSNVDDSLDLPEWLAQYLDACGQRLLGWQPESVELRPHHWGHLPEEKPPKRGEGPRAFGRALGFSEGLALARENWGGQFNEREKLALQVVDLMWNERRSLGGAAQKLEYTQDPDEGTKWPDRRTIRRYVADARSWTLRRMQERLFDATGAVPEPGKMVRAYSDLCRKRNVTKLRR